MLQERFEWWSEPCVEQGGHGGGAPTRIRSGSAVSSAPGTRVRSGSAYPSRRVLPSDTFGRVRWPSLLLLTSTTGLTASCERPEPTGVVSAGPPSVVLISMDTLRADRLGAYGNPNGVTPNLDKFAAEAVVFDGAYSQAIQTAPSHGSVFTGKYPSEQTGPGNQPSLDPERVTLAQMLTLYGYQTAAFVAGADLSPHRKLDRGFTTYKASVDFGSLHHTTPMALAWLEAADKARPLFLMVHGYDSHSLYLKPAPYGYLHADLDYSGEAQTLVRTATERLIDGQIYSNFDGLLQTQITLLRPRDPAGIPEVARMMKRATGEPKPVVDEDIEHIRDVYDGAVSYADAMFGTFMAGLERHGVLDNAYVIVMSDHGEQLGEHGLFGHCCNVGEEETKVVLMIRAPKGQNGGRHVAGYTELVDILPTVADIAGVPPPGDTAGRSLFAAVQGEPFEPRAFVHAQGSHLSRTVTVRGHGGRLTYTGLAPTCALLADVVDAARLDGPGFLASDAPADARPALREEMVRWLRALDPPPSRNTAAPLPDALRKSLREHGYFEVEK